MNIEKVLRKLSKEIRFQNLFSAAKEIYGIRLFRNERNLSKLQELFLSYLYIYHEIFQDISLKKITEDILKDEDYQDAYIIWKREKGESNEKSKNKKRAKGKDIKLIFTHKSSKENK